MRRILSIILVLLMVFSLVGCGGGAPASTNGTNGGDQTEPIVLKLQGAFPEGTVNYYFFDQFCDLVYERSNGTIKVEWGAGPEAIATTELAEAMINGMVDLVFTPITYLVTVAPILNGVRMTEPKEMRESGGVEYIDSLTQEHLNAKFLARTVAETKYYMAVNKKITKLSDFEGLVLRGNAAYLPMIEGVGAEMATAEWGEVYQAIERNVFDGAGGTLKDYVDNSLGGVLKYLIMPGFFNSDAALFVSLNVWEKLDDVQKQALLDSAIDWEVDSARHFSELNEKMIQTLQEAGMEIIEFEGELRDEYLNTIYENGWERLKRIDPEAAEKMRSFTSN